MKARVIAVLGLFLPAVVPGYSYAAGESSWSIAGGTPHLDLRLRSEQVRQHNDLRHASAFTLRARLGYTTAPWQGLQGMLEMAAVGDLGNGRYNSLRNGEAGRSVVADPDGARVNQAKLMYSGLPGLAVTVGRQRIVHDNARFIGNVGWRQNEQTFDAVQLRTTPVPGGNLSYTYLHRVNGIILTSARLQGHLLNAHYEPLRALQLTAYGYWLDFDENTPGRADTRTIGARAGGKFDAGIGIGYTLEYARQSGHADTPEADASYWLAELTAHTGPVTFAAGYEVLGGDGGYGFQTPLATLHAFQGWADIFLATPADGVRDLRLSASGAVKNTHLAAAWHRFEADTGGAYYGREWDLQAARSLGHGLSLAVKYADYRARALAVNTRKFWVMAQYRF